MSRTHGALPPLRKRLSKNQLIVRSEKITRRREEKEAARLLAQARSRRRKQAVAK